MKRERLPDGSKAIYLGAVEDHPEYVQWEGQIVTIQEETEVEAEARLVRQHINGSDHWFGVIVSPVRDISAPHFQDAYSEAS